MSPFSSILLLLCAALPVLATAQSCYGLDGVKLNSSFVPCDASGKQHSGCCAATDICLNNNLCMATQAEYVGTMWSAGCTDPTGKDKSCPQHCPSIATGFRGLDPVPAWNIQSCDIGLFCCRTPNDPQSCCTNDSLPRIATPSIGFFPVRLQLAGDAFASPNSVSCAKAKRTTAIVGGTLGSLLGVALLSATAVILWLHGKEQRQRRLKEHYEEQIAQTGAYRRVLAAAECNSSLRRIDTEEVLGKDSE